MKIICYLPNRVIMHVYTLSQANTHLCSFQNICTEIMLWFFTCLSVLLTPPQKCRNFKLFKDGFIQTWPYLCSVTEMVRFQDIWTNSPIQKLYSWPVCQFLKWLYRQENLSLYHRREKAEKCQHPQEMQLMNWKSITINIRVVLQSSVGKGRG